jgi:hypothetical protein
MASKTAIGIGVATATCAGALLAPACAFAAGARHAAPGWAQLAATAAPIASGAQGVPVTTGGVSPQPVVPGGTAASPQPSAPGGTTASPQPALPVTTTTVVSIGASAHAGQTMTVRAQVHVGRSHPHGIKALSGTVTFRIDGTSGGPVIIKRGRATERITLAAGKHTIVATYSGDADHKTSTSAPFTFTLN